jgi:hypothetical protein
MVNICFGNRFSFRVDHETRHMPGLGEQKIFKCLGPHQDHSPDDTCKNSSHAAYYLLPV